MQNEYKTNQLLQLDNQIIRIIEINENNEDKVLIINCIKKTMPVWVKTNDLAVYNDCPEDTLFEATGFYPFEIHTMPNDIKKVMYQRFTLISPIIAFISDYSKSRELIRAISTSKNISQQTIRKYLCLFLTYQDISVLVPKVQSRENQLTQDEKNMRWALNKFFYTKRKNSLNLAYTLLLKAKYTDSYGQLLSEYPSFYQFRYFYRKTRKKQTYLISREGLTVYQRNKRPLLGENIQQYASSVGMGMLDSTTCDIYLVDDSGTLLGRPILTACIDAYSSLCCGYVLSWEGGVQSLQKLMLNIITDKQEHCKQFGILIDKSQWDSDMLPAVMVTDRGSEYVSSTFEQITDLGVTLTNLPPYRPELKGAVEKFFDVVQSLYKPHLIGKGVIEPDYQERGAHDYRKDACLTIKDFEKILLRCIIYYNSQRIIKNFPYNEEMIQKQIKPYASSIFNYGKTKSSSNLIDVTEQQIMMTLLPRATGNFTRAGLKVNKLRYKCDGYTEEYLSGKEVTVAYNPNNTSNIWLIENGQYVPFELIESRYKNSNIKDVEELQMNKKNIINTALKQNTQAQINLASSIETIAALARKTV